MLAINYTVNFHTTSAVFAVKATANVDPYNTSSIEDAGVKTFVETYLYDEKNMPVAKKALAKSAVRAVAKALKETDVVFVDEVLPFGEALDDSATMVYSNAVTAVTAEVTGWKLK